MLKAQPGGPLRRHSLAAHTALIGQFNEIFKGAITSRRAECCFQDHLGQSLHLQRAYA